MMWEYEVLSLCDEGAFKAKLNELGATGWELMHATSHFVRYAPTPAGYGTVGSGGGAWPPQDGYTQWDATLRRAK